ncbi:hypothetical protein FH972_000048 [Carpinus fangiana]|uniref:Microtubule-associated protein 70-5 n=1 Tax=Carpinus fangiana TaxID=176857 RepID=A0A5N6Q7K8_9ROSI|nr:hypothetical protein FH972_000048 [Carpinus fangiana]
MGSHDQEQLGCEELSLAHPDPVVLELNQKDRELGVAQGEIKALRGTEALKDKAIEELTNEVNKMEEKLRATENLLEHKNLEIKKLTSERKEALAAQYAAEATLRRVHANQKDDESLPIASVIAPLEAEIKMYKNEVAALQDDKKALERLTKSKELALLEAQRILRSALERALIVEEVQNHNYELKRQIEICQEENRILEKTNRQKVLEVEKLSQTIQELEEAILAGGAAANAVRDYKRQIEELHEEKRTLERELARNKVLANRVATVVANEWKDENDKVMPVKQWIEERRLLQAEMQRLRDKLAISDRTAKAEAQLKDKLKLRLKIIEEGLKDVTSFSVNPNRFCGSPKTEKSSNFFGFLTSNGGLRKRSTSQPRASTISRSSPLQQPNVEPETAHVAAELKQANSLKKKYASGENMMRKDPQNKGNNEDVVSGFLYDRLQKEVINLRKLCEVKNSTLNAKDEEVKMLVKKVDALTKAIEVESKKMKREAAAREKEAASLKMDDNRKNRFANSSISDLHSLWRSFLKLGFQLLQGIKSILKIPFLTLEKVEII